MTYLYAIRLLKVNTITVYITKVFIVQRVSKRMTRFQIIISNNEKMLQLQNKLQNINPLAQEISFKF